MKKKLFTHDRTVHADDALAAAILRFCYDDIDVVRTRDPLVLREAMMDENNYFIDIGGKYDPARRLFDHHQTEGAGFRDPEKKEWPFATAGLVWRHFGAHAVMNLHPCLDPESVDEVVRYIDDTVLRYVDAVDCGVRLKSSGPSLSAIIGSFNTTWYEKDEDVFPLVLEVASVLLANFIKRFAGQILARDRVRKASFAHDGRVLVLEGCHPWGTVVAEEMPSVLIVVYPVEDGKVWQLRTASDTDKKGRMFLPVQWAGLERDALAAVSGESKATFCHRSRHLAGAFSREGALCLAQAAISQHLCAHQLQVA